MKRFNLVGSVDKVSAGRAKKFTNVDYIYNGMIMFGKEPLEKMFDEKVGTVDLACVGIFVNLETKTMEIEGCHYNEGGELDRMASKIFSLDGIYTIASDTFIFEYTENNM